MACPRDHDASGMPVHWGHTQIVTLFWCGEYEGSLLKWKVGDQNCRNPANKANIIITWHALLSSYSISHVHFTKAANAIMKGKYELIQGQNTKFLYIKHHFHIINKHITPETKQKTDFSIWIHIKIHIRGITHTETDRKLSKPYQKKRT